MFLQTNLAVTRAKTYENKCFNFKNKIYSRNDYIAGELNLYVLDDDGETLTKTEKFNNFTVIGKQGIVVINQRGSFYNCTCNFRGFDAKDCMLIIDVCSYPIANLNIMFSDPNSTVYIGKQFSCSGARLYLYNNSNIIIGNDNMWSSEIVIRTGDGHSILNSSGDILNNPESVFIDDHTWICENVKILKGVRINENTIIGANSTVTKLQTKCKNCIIAGSPAKIIKKKINWHRQRPYSLSRIKTSKSFENFINESFRNE